MSMHSNNNTRLYTKMHRGGAIFVAYMGCLITSSPSQLHNEQSLGYRILEQCITITMILTRSLAPSLSTLGIGDLAEQKPES